MAKTLRKTVTFLERLLSPALAKILYPPVGANTVCIHDDQVIVLDIGEDYNFPGGLINPKEHPSETAKREFKEETGLNTEIKDLITIETEFNGITGIHFFYSAQLKSGFEDSIKSWEGNPTKVDKTDLRPEMQKVIDKIEKIS